MIDQQDYRELVRMVAYEQAKLSTSAWFFTGEDNLRVRSFGSLTGVVLALEGRFLRADGEIVAFAERHVPQSDRTEATSVHALGQGFLFNLSVRASIGTPRVGQVFATVEVVRGSTGAVQILGALVAGYVTDTQRLAWPGSPTQHSTDGPGVIRTIVGTDPAAGAECLEIVPTNARWRLLSARVTLTTSATVATRYPVLQITNGAVVLAAASPLFGQPASTSYPWTYTPGIEGSGVTAVAVTVEGPGPLMCPGGYQILSLTSGLAAGDNWNAPQLLVEEWIED